MASSDEGTGGNKLLNALTVARVDRGLRRVVRAAGRHRLATALIASILLHGLALLLSPSPEVQQGSPAMASASEPLSVQIVPSLPGPSAAAPVPAERAPRPAPRAPERAQEPRAPAVEPPVTAPVPAPPAKDAPLPPLPPTAPPIDMAAMIRANRERRRAADGAMARGPMSGGPMTGGESAGAAALNRNLQTLAGDGGAGGVFQILRIGARTGSFAFNGWRGGTSSRVRREVFEVDAGPDGDVEMAMVRKMIALIREDYPGDFRWESRRQGRVVTLSAASEHTAELEDYLMREFFDSPARGGAVGQSVR